MSAVESRCNSETKSGGKCKLKPKDGSEFCHIHSKKVKIETDESDNNVSNNIEYKDNELIQDLKHVFGDESAGLLQGKFKLTKNELDDILRIEMEKHTIVLNGKQCKTGRDLCFYSDFSKGYRFSGNIIESRQLTEHLRNILEKVNKYTNSDFNGILINRYNNGSEYVGAHSDDERSLGKNGVVTFTIGSSRIFRIRDKKSEAILKDLVIHDSDIYWMTGNFQKKYTHEIPKQLRVKEPRISLTFRKHLE